MVVFAPFTSFFSNHSIGAEDEPPSSSSASTSSTQVASPSPEKPISKEYFVPGIYFADPNPEHSFEEGEADFIPLPTSSPIKYLPSQTQRTANAADNYSQDRGADSASYENMPESIEVKVETHVGPPLSPQQQEVLRRVLRGESVFFTGSAGNSLRIAFKFETNVFDN